MLTMNHQPTVAVGDRVRLIHFHVSAEGPRDEHGLIRDAHGDVITIDDNVTVPPGTKGTVDSIDGIGSIHVRWDNGSRLALLPGYDEWERLPGAK